VIGGIVLVQWNCCGTVALLYSGIVLVQWHCCGTVALLWYSGIVVVQWHCCGTVALFWYSGIVVVQWHCCGTVAFKGTVKSHNFAALCSFTAYRVQCSGSQGIGVQFPGDPWIQLCDDYFEGYLFL
jgi:hypothetical protein